MDISVFSSMLSVTAKTEKRREGKKLRQYLAALSATIAPFAVGTVLAWTSPVLPKLQNVNNTEVDVHITDAEGSWIGSIIAIGAIFGSIPAGWGADILGRKPVIASLAIPFVISWGMIIVSKSVMMFFIARFIAGVVIGAVTATIPMYIGEISETSVRGQLGSYIQLMVTIGILYVYVLALFVDYNMLNYLCGVIPIVFLVAFLLVAPESPTYLVRMNRRKEAERALISLRGQEYDIYSELDEIQQQLDEERSRKQSWRVLFTSRAVIRATIAVMGLLSFLSFSGINVVIFYAEKIFQASNTTIRPDIASMIIGVMQVVMTYASGLLVDRAGRRILLLVSDCIMAVCLIALGFYFWAQEQHYNVDDISWLPLVSLSIYISTFSLGFGPIPGIMMGELFAPEAKGFALGTVCVLASLLEFVVVKGFHNLLTWFNFSITFWIFAGNCLVGTFFVYFLVPETKNKSLQQIQDELSGKSSNYRRSNRDINKKKNKSNMKNGTTKKRPIVTTNPSIVTNPTNINMV